MAVRKEEKDNKRDTIKSITTTDTKKMEKIYVCINLGIFRPVAMTINSIYYVVHTRTHVSHH